MGSQRPSVGVARGVWTVLSVEARLVLASRRLAFRKAEACAMGVVMTGEIPCRWRRAGHPPSSLPALDCSCMLGSTCQVPEYATGEKINLHPLITHPYIQVRKGSEAEESSVMKVVKRLLREELDFVRCRDVRTDWKVSG